MRDYKSLRVAIIVLPWLTDRHTDTDRQLLTSCSSDAWSHI